MKKQGEAVLKEHMSRCLSYTGLAVNVVDRVSSHWVHKNTESPMFGLITAIARYLYSDLYDIKSFSYQIFRTTDVPDIGLDEQITSILTSSQWWNGGLNYTHCGGNLGSGPYRTDLSYLKALDKNARSIEQPGLITRNIAEAQSKFGQAEKTFEYCRTAEGSRLQLNTQAKSLKAEVDSLKKEVERDSLNDEFQNMVQSFDALDSGWNRDEAKVDDVKEETEQVELIEELEEMASTDSL